LAVFLVIQICNLPGGSWFDYSTRLDTFPVRACDFLLSHPKGARLFNHYSWGGYCIWRLWPRYRVFIDGRAEVYFETSYADNRAILTMQPGWERMLHAWGVETVLMPADALMARVLSERPGWRRIYADECAVVLERVGAGIAAEGKAVKGMRG
jgi:hypothetical protein